MDVVAFAVTPFLVAPFALTVTRGGEDLTHIDCWLKPACISFRCPLFEHCDAWALFFAGFRCTQVCSVVLFSSICMSH